MADERNGTGSPIRGRRTARERRGRDRRVLALGLALSLVIHLIALGVLGGLLDRRPEELRRPTSVVAIPPGGLRAVELQPVPEDGVERPTLPRVEREPAPVRPTPVRTPAETELEVPAEADDVTAADRLAPRVVDARLWRPMVILPGEPTIEDVQSRVAAAVELLSDSALAETERAVRATDWTVEDADGGKWGISPGKLHLGKLTLPLPISFPTSLAAEEQNARFLEIQSQMDRALFLESFEARVKAIRERRDRERADRIKADNGNGS